MRISKLRKEGQIYKNVDKNKENFNKNSNKKVSNILGNNIYLEYICTQIQKKICPDIEAIFQKFIT